MKNTENISSKPREQFGSRLGFLLVSAGCAIGLGNVWRFPYITGEYGGGAFVLLYLVFLVIVALPILIMEYSMGRASKRSIGTAFNKLEPAGSKWHVWRWPALIGNYLLMMFYTVVAGWMIAYLVKAVSGQLVGIDATASAQIFSNLLANPVELTIFMLITVAVGIACTRAGLKNGVERVTKIMMAGLFIVLIALCINSLTLEGGAAGLAFYLMPDFSKFFTNGWLTFGDAIYAAMGQAFFTVSTGVGCMLIFGSYINKEHTLPSEALRVVGLDTAVAFMSGLIIFPACFAFAIEPGSGPSLIFITLPTVFAQMPMGELWCALFFLFMSFAALSTIIAVFENIMAMTMEIFHITRPRACLINAFLLAILSMPCVLGFNVLSDFTVTGIGDIQSIEDFIFSNNILPLGGLFILLFCTRKAGWGWKSFTDEANAGEGIKFPQWARIYVSYILPILIVIVFVMGYIPTITALLGA